MKRIYKNKKEYIEGKPGVIICDDRGLHIDYFSDISCYKCKHFRQWDYFCKAYPNGIPDELIYGKEKHTEVQTDQKGTTVFEEKIKHSKSKNNTTKIKLSQKEIEAINKYFNGEMETFSATHDQMRIFGPLLDKAKKLMLELNAANEIGHIIEWFWNKYQELNNLKKVA
ncbi:MAG: hypothetical protein FWH18_08960 [Marinilabiliaceae bacterium]|nr:hypothetical protein [Marinilabiliaceae bacterium]